MFEEIFKPKIEDEKTQAETAPDIDKEQTADPHQEQTVEQEKPIEEQFAAELENTPKGQFKKKLGRIAAAFTLAGFLMGAGEAIAPQPSEESFGIHELDKTKREIPGLYNKILDQIKEKGGIITSPQLPDNIYKPQEIAGLARKLANASEEPFYNKPEIILGKKFIKENPEKSAEYIKKIKDAMKATVMLLNEKGTASGVLIEKNEKKFILTNAHVSKVGPYFIALLYNKDYIFATSKVQDEKTDIALLEISNIDEKGNPIDMEKKFVGTKNLELEKDDKKSFKQALEPLASIGNPLGFPFAVGISERVLPGNNQKGLYYIANNRFAELEYYIDRSKEHDYKKVGSIPGMSGGPVIGLERDGEAKLIGLTSMGVKYKDTVLNVGVSLAEIEEFLQKNL